MVHLYILTKSVNEQLYHLDVQHIGVTNKNMGWLHLNHLVDMPIIISEVVIEFRLNPEVDHFI